MKKTKRTKPKPKPRPANPATELKDTFHFELARLRKEVDLAHQSYKARIDDPAEAYPYLTNYLKLIATLTSLAKVQPKADLDAKSVLLKSDVEATWLRWMVEARSILESVPRRLATLPIFHGLDPILIEEACDKEIELVIARLRGDLSADKEDQG